MPRKDPAARKTYNDAYRSRLDNKLRATQRDRLRRLDPKKVAADRRKKQLHIGLPEPTRPMPERCECCNREPDAKRALHLDHSHNTGKFRGWLCHHCNTGIGLLGDDALGVRFALVYLSLNG